ncbi:MAG: iron-containing alcohol dehydrogenase [Solirubrobacterales bacterium]
MPELTWRDAARDRVVILRRGLIAETPKALDEYGWREWELLSTERALAGAPGLRDAAGAVHLVQPGPVPEAAAAILDQVGAESLVALGGGRVIDSAKAVAAVRGGLVAAVPTTLSGAPMTAIHRLPAGQEGRGGVRPAVVLADPDAMTSAPEQQLRATAMNALAHGAESLYTPLADGLSRGAALRGAAMIARSLDAGRTERDDSELTLGALLCAYAVDRAGIALHHVLGQTIVRVCGTPHAETYAALLPVTMEAMRERAPERIGALAESLGTTPTAIGDRIADLGGGRRRLGELGADPERIDEVLDTAMARPELFRMTPGELTREELRAILESGW